MLYLLVLLYCCTSLGTTTPDLLLTWLMIITLRDLTTAIMLYTQKSCARVTSRDTPFTWTQWNDVWS